MGKWSSSSLSLYTRTKQIRYWLVQSTSHESWIKSGATQNIIILFPQHLRKVISRRNHRWYLNWTQFHCKLGGYTWACISICRICSVIYVFYFLSILRLPREVCQAHHIFSLPFPTGKVDHSLSWPLPHVVIAMSDKACLGCTWTANLSITRPVPNPQHHCTHK